MSSVPELSIVMATFRRAETLRKTLAHLQAQDIAHDRFELIMVDDASQDNTAEVVQELRAQLDFEIKLLVNPDNRGPGYTQNRGIREARAPLLMIMTDDVFLAPGALRAHLDYHQRHPAQEAAVLGRVTQSPELRDTALMRNWDPFRFWLIDAEQTLPFYMFWACNVSCKTAFMLEHGMFREHRGRGGPVAFEDLEVGYRLSLSGMQLRHAEHAAGLHYHPYTVAQGIARWYERGLNFDEFREYVPDPVLTVYFHVLNRHTFADYANVLRNPNPFEGKEKRMAWHLFRHVVQSLVLNRVTEKLIWRPLIDGAERSALLERVVNRHVYRVFFYYHFLRGVKDGYQRFGVTRHVVA